MVNQKFISTCFLFSILFMTTLCSCGITWGPARIYSEDPNQAQLQRADDAANQARAEAFIADHPELDTETKKELRDGTLTPSGALEQMKEQAK